MEGQQEDNQLTGLKKEFINLLSSIDPTIDWSKVQWDHQEGEGFGSCTSDDPETKQKLLNTYQILISRSGK